MPRLFPAGSSVTVPGTIAVTQSGTWTVGRTWVLDSSTDSVASVQSGSWTVSVTGSVTVTGTVAATQSGTWNIGTVTTLTSITNPVAVTQSGSWTVTADTELAAAILADDSTAAPTTAPTYSFLMGLKSGTNQWARARMAPDNADALATDATGHIQVLAHTILYNGTTWDRARGDISNGLDVDVTRVQGTVAVTQSGAWTVGVSGTVTVSGTVAATQSGTWNIATVTTVTTVATVTNLSQLGGAAISMNTGVRDAGTQRVTIATNDVVPVSQSGTWNIATVTTVTTVATVTNLSQLGGAAISMNTGVRDAGTQRVTIATNDVVPVSQSGTWNIATVTTVTTVATVTSLTQFNGQAIALNTGTRSAGTLRVTIATDDVVPASQSGTWNIATVTTVTTVSSVTAVGTITPGTAASSLGKAEDAAHASGDVGVMALGVRRDTPTALGADGDYIPPTFDLLGAQHVSHVHASKMATPTLSNVAGSASSVTLLSANTARRQVILVNDSSAICYVKFGTTASTTSYTVQMAAIANSQAAHLILEEPSIYTGRIDAIWASATGNMRISEVAT